MLSEAVIRELDEIISRDAPYRKLAEQYAEYVLAGDRKSASNLIIEKVESGTPVKDIYLQVFQPDMYLTGRLWQLKIISVAQEHLFTAMTQSIMAQLYPYIMSGNKNDNILIATCVGNELHEMGIRMVADMFESEGWNTLFLGANTPSKTVAEAVASEKAHILAISTTMMFHLKNTQELIKEVKKNREETGIMVGGIALNSRPELWKLLGAQGFASNAEDAISVAKSILESKEQA
ncbi:Cobalamin B12-binding domain-containing protein (fragment) [Desulfamplus magnetovallimortis]|uniref:Cobalamin B12-binding domain-containing protein n=1 Tax=Desulfamplus magnetovallimortis TaxID=1246637 RepID=A0A1W1HI46_9BACT